MSAEVRATYVVYCADCNDGDGPHDYESEAEDWAENHDAEYHNEPDRADEAYDNYLESLRNE